MYFPVSWQEGGNPGLQSLCGSALSRIPKLPCLREGASQTEVPAPAPVPGLGKRGKRSAACALPWRSACALPWRSAGRGHFLFCWYFCWYFCRNCTAVIGQCGSLHRNQTAFRHHHAIQRQPSPDPTNACAKGVPVPPVDNWPAHTTRAWTAAARCASSPRSSLPTA
jgi:hypothetical protein